MLKNSRSGKAAQRGSITVSFLGYTAAVGASFLVGLASLKTAIDDFGATKKSEATQVCIAKSYQHDSSYRQDFLAACISKQHAEIDQGIKSAMDTIDKVQVL